MAVLPAAVDPNNMGLNITPYDEDDNSAAGTTTLRHIDQSTRLAWSTFGSVQSDPYSWGHATLPGYTPPADRPTTPPAAERVEPEPRTGSTRRRRSPSPRATACRSPAVCRRRPAAASRSTARCSRPARWTIDIDAAGPGMLHAFLYDGEKGYTPVFNTSCARRPTRRRTTASRRAR